MAQILVKLDVPKNWQGFKLPPALNHRLQQLLDRQEREGKLSIAERPEAKALVDLVDMLSWMRQSAEQAKTERP